MGHCKDGNLTGSYCNLTPSCAKPVGDTCEYYSECLPKNCDTIENVAIPKCKVYQDMEPSVGADGQVWLQ